jgi:histidyl-tRNA synthetase
MLLPAVAAPPIDIAVVPMGEAAETAALEVLAMLRRAGISAEQTWRGTMKKRMQRADAAGARLAVILGDDEIAAGAATVKDLTSGEQRRVALGALIEALR